MPPPHSIPPFDTSPGPASSPSSSQRTQGVDLSSTPYPSNGGPSSTPYTSNGGPSAAPSFQTPSATSGPTYASLSYPTSPDPSLGPSPRPPDGWGMQSPPYLSQQPFQQRSFPGPGGLMPPPPFPNGYPGPQANGYAPQPYYSSFPQMGEPGPGTLHNYGPYNSIGGYPPYMRSGPDQPDPSHFSPNGMNGVQSPNAGLPPNGIDSSDSGKSVAHDVPPYIQRPRPPHIPPPGQEPFPPGNGYSQMPNGSNRSPPPMQSQYQPMYPPGHPYAFGGGVGYQPYPPIPNMYGGFGYDQGPVPNLPMSHTSPRRPGSFNKALNPAAAGFNYARPPRPPRDPAPPQMNGAPPSLPRPTPPVFANVFPSTQSPAPPPPLPMPNGHVDPQQWSLPAMIDGEKLKGIGVGPDPSHETNNPVIDSSLGLSQMEPTAPDPAGATSSQPEPTVIPTNTTSTPSMSFSPTTPATIGALQTPRASHGSELAPSSSKPPTSASSADQWNFVGPTISGYTSPSTSAFNTQSLSQALSASTSSSSSSRPVRSKPAAPTGNHGSIKLSARRPSAAMTKGNLFAASLSGTIPATMEKVDVTEEEPAQDHMTTKGRKKPLRHRVLVRIGSQGLHTRPQGPSSSNKAFAFGSLELSDLSLPTSTSTLLPAVPIESPAKTTAPVDTTLAVTSRTETLTPVPKVKPSSWAALLRPEGSSATSSPKVLSPPRSITSFLPDSEALSSPSSPVLEAVTTGSTSAKQSPAAPVKPRPAFNYAAAAAHGATLTPQQELARLLTDGIRTRGRDVRGTLPRGLINTGNMCFANTILQVLVYCPPFTELLEELGKRLRADLARRTPLLEAMIIFLREFIPAQKIYHTAPTANSARPLDGRNERDQKQEAFIPENVYDAMKENKRFDSMRRGFQEDAEEYLGFFLNTLHEELLYIYARTQSSPRPPLAALPNGNASHDERSIQRPISPNNSDSGPWLEVGKRQKVNVVRSTETRETAVSRLFGGTIRSVLHTPGSKDSVTLEPYQPLQLEVESPEVLSLTDALSHLSVPETVPGVWSASRGENVDATKQVYIETFPPVLILHLKRFVYDGEEMSVVKKSKPVAYGTELVIPPGIISPGRRASSVKYRLFGVVYHHGNSASGGHYTVAVARQDGAGWIHFDDELVSTVPVEDVMVSADQARDGRAGLIGGREKCAYLLFYQRVRS